jgi:hypothetical protein
MDHFSKQEVLENYLRTKPWVTVYKPPLIELVKLWDKTPKIGWLVSVDTEHMVYTSINVKQFEGADIEPLRPWTDTKIYESQTRFNEELETLGLTRVEYQPPVIMPGDCVWANGTYARVYEIKNVPCPSCPDGETWVIHFQRLMLPSIGSIRSYGGHITYGWDSCNHLDAKKITEEEFERGMRNWHFDTLPKKGILPCPPQ